MGFLRAKLMEIFSNQFFIWLTPLLEIKKEEGLTLDDLPAHPEELCANKLGDKLEIAWAKECADASKVKAQRPRFHRALWRVFWHEYLTWTALLLVNEIIIKFVQAYLLKRFIISFSCEDSELHHKLGLLIGFILFSFNDVTLVNPIGLGYIKLGYKCGSSTSSLIYRKLLKLNKNSQRSTNLGQIVNLLNVNCMSFPVTLRRVSYLLYMPIQISLFIYCLWVELGSHSLIGIGLYFTLIPIQYIIGKFNIKFKKETEGWSDKRSQIMTEVIHGIRNIKIFGWEKVFVNLVLRARRGEMAILKKSGIVSAFVNTTFTITKLFSYVTIAFFMASGGDVNPESIFFTLAIFRMFRQSLAGHTPGSIAAIGEIVNSCRRIEEFLTLEEQVEDKNFRRTQSGDTRASIELRGISASWNGESTLKDLSLKLRGSGLVIVSGAVGSGKSSLLSLLIEELPLSRGQAEVNGRISYASQDPWLFPGSVRQNILFGTPPDEVRYSKVLQVCALEEDLVSFPQGDATQVGERGVSLSGGQRSRINLARALYRNADIYLLDDPLSSVDSQVSKHIFQRGILEFLSGKLVLLVTHHLQYAPLANQILILKEGSLIKDPELHKKADFGIPYEISQIPVQNGRIPLPNLVNPEKSKGDSNEVINDHLTPLLTPWKTCWNYLRCGNSLYKLFFMSSLFLTFQILDQAADFWLSLMTSKRENEGTPVNLTLILAILFGTLICSLVRDFSFYSSLVQTNGNVHKKMVEGVMSAPVSFYNQNQSGRILNRFSQDLNMIDSQLPTTFFECIIVSLSSIGIVSFIGYNHPMSLVPTFLLGWFIMRIKKKYMRNFGRIKQLEYQMRNPLITHVASTLQGLPTIRSSRGIGRQIKEFDIHQDHFGLLFYLDSCFQRWFTIRSELCVIFSLAFASLTFLFMDKEVATAAAVGLTLSSFVAMSGPFKWGMMQLAATEVMMSSVERTLEYTRISPEETPLEEYKKMSKEWPSEGGLSFSGVSLSYDGRNDVLKGLEFQVRPLEKVGVIGRTGAGKSSIVAALLRIKEATGIIRIDGVDIRRVPIQRLRNSVSVIPQNPVLFSGSVRFNLDPFGVYSEEELRSAIDQVELGEVVKSLDDLVLEEGSNLSVGQRQLLCLARALLRKNRILILDEATANVDQTTDRLIQKTLKNNFRDCTKLVIAHRLNSILDSDRILVIDNGQIKEFDQPKKLLQKKNGIFKMLLDQSST